MQKILITFCKRYFEHKQWLYLSWWWGLGLAPTRQTQKGQYACPDVTSLNCLHSDPDVGGNVFRGTRKKRKEAKEKKEYVYRYNIYIIISYIILYLILYYILYYIYYYIIFIYIILLYILLYILILIFFCYFSFSPQKTFSQFSLMISV